MNFRIKDLPNRAAGRISAFAVTLSLFGSAFAAGGCTLATGENAEQGNTSQEQSGPPTTVDVSPDGNHLLFTGNGRGITDIFTLNLTTGKVEQITDTDTEEQEPKYSADGQSIVFSRAKPGYTPDGDLFERYLYVMDLATKEVTQITDDLPRYDYSPAFSSDGRFVVFDGATLSDGNGNFYGDDLYCTEIATKKTTRLTSERFNSRLYPALWQNDTAVLLSIHRNINEAEGSYLVSLPFNGSTPVSFASAQVMTPKRANYYEGRLMEEGRMVLISDPGRKWIWRLTIREADGSFTYLDDSINGMSSHTYDQANHRIFYLEGMDNLYCYDLKTKTKKKIADDALFVNPLASKLDQLP